jgi:hypothetical protein
MFPFLSFCNSGDGEDALLMELLGLRLGLNRRGRGDLKKQLVRRSMTFNS